MHFSCCFLKVNLEIFIGLLGFCSVNLWVKAADTWKQLFASASREKWRKKRKANDSSSYFLFLVGLEVTCSPVGTEKKKGAKYVKNYIWNMIYCIHSHSLYACWNQGSNTYSDHLLLWVVSIVLGTKLHNSALENSTKKKPFYFFTYKSLFIKKAWWTVTIKILEYEWSLCSVHANYVE